MGTLRRRCGGMGLRTRRPIRPLVARARGLADLLPCRRRQSATRQDGIHSPQSGSLADWSPNVMDPRRGNARRSAVRRGCLLGADRERGPSRSGYSARHRRCQLGEPERAEGYAGASRVATLPMSGEPIDSCTLRAKSHCRTRWASIPARHAIRLASPAGSAASRSSQLSMCCRGRRHRAGGQ